MTIQTGDALPADGIVVQSFNMKLNQSNVTGEPDLVAKEVHKEGVSSKSNPFLIADSTCAEGSGSMLVVAVGEYSTAGQVKKSLLEDDEEGTFLQLKLEKIAEDIGKLGFAVALLTIVALIVHLLINLYAYGDGWHSGAWSNVVEALIIGVTIVVVAVPEGLPLAVTISLAYSVSRMRTENNLVRKLDACETMGSVNIICSDKTGTLTENRMEVVIMNAADRMEEKVNFTTELFDSDFTRLLCVGICENSDAGITKGEKGLDVLTGNRTECALLLYARAMGYDYVNYRKPSNFGNRIPFSSMRKRMTTVVKDEEGKYICYSKGASEILLDMCEKM
jgi:Ca2+ transporting ATPase